MRSAPPADHVPDAERLRAWLDSELRGLAWLRCDWHVRRCATCAGELDRLRRDDHRVAALFAGLGAGVDVESGWRRLGGPPRRATLARPALWLAVAAALAGLVVTVRARTGGEAHAATLQDRCCWDLDGGGPGDDGVLAVTLPGERVLQLTVYEDTNRSRSISASDRIRFGMLEALRGLARADARRGGVESERTIVRDACCSDHDGGGDPDDGLLTINRPGEVVDRVVLYEDADASAGWSAGDRVLWAGGVGPDVRDAGARRP